MTETKRSWWLPVVLFTVAAALVVAGVVFLVRAHDLNSSGATDNGAVIDRKTTSEVIAQVSTGLNQVLSYDYTKPQVAAAAGKRWLTGDAPAQYQVLFNVLRQKLKGRDLTLTAKVAAAGVVTLRGNTARLLVFVDQRSSVLNPSAQSVAAAQVQITAVHRGDRWLISELKPI